MPEIGHRWWGMLMDGGGALATGAYLLHYRGRIWPTIAAVMGPVQLSELSQELKPAPARGPTGDSAGTRLQPPWEGDGHGAGTVEAGHSPGRLPVLGGAG